MFKAVDKDGSGQLSERELRAALVNGDWTAFDPQTVRMMIRMFDSDRSGTINFEEFWSVIVSLKGETISLMNLSKADYGDFSEHGERCLIASTLTGAET
ncbi:MAG: hypothetical protein M1829_000622 [Trizodia sp. TS-e1964]|nr:MAG: hypothetical protein M1829_000622 [Trizodia sp. TS-e1964]